MGKTKTIRLYYGVKEFDIPLFNSFDLYQLMTQPINNDCNYTNNNVNLN